MYAAPEGMSVHQATFNIFTRYCKSLKSANKPTSTEDVVELSMDGKSFSKLCQEAPDLGEYIGRTDVDLIFVVLRLNCDIQRKFCFDAVLPRTWLIDNKCFAIVNLPFPCK